MDRSRSLSDTEWMKEAACKDESPDMFHPNDGAGVEMAQVICGQCVVRERCLEYAIENRIDNGVWGGVSERMRRRIIKERRLTRQQQIDRGAQAE